MPLSETQPRWRAKLWDVILNRRKLGEVGRCSPKANGGNSWYLYKGYRFVYFKTKRDLIKGITKWLASYVKPKKT